MSGATGNFALLMDLAREGSTEKRRELLRKITDAFLEQPDERSDREAKLFDEIVGAVAADLETQVRVELARKVALSDAPVHRTARRLAMDVIEVARPVIENSKALTEHDILDVIEQKSQEHMLAVTARSDIGETVSSALVAKGDDRVVVSLLENRTARISRETYQVVAERANASPVLQAPLVRNQKVPLDLLNTIYLKVGAELRRDIMQRFHGVSPGELEAALEASRIQLAADYGALPEDFQEARMAVQELEASGAMKPPVLVQLLRENSHTAFLIALSKFLDVDFGLVRRLVDARDIDALATLCRSGGFDRNLFATIGLLVMNDKDGIGRTEEYARMYEQVPVAAAQRAVRFWKLRARSASEAEAA